MLTKALFVFAAVLAVTGAATQDTSQIDKFLGKKYVLDTSENFDEFMKALGVGFFTRKISNALFPVVELYKEGDNYVLTSISTFKNIIVKFKPGVEFDQETADGRTVKATINVNGPKLTEIQKEPELNRITTIERTWSDKEIKMYMFVGDVSATRVYKLQS